MMKHMKVTLCMLMLAAAVTGCTQAADSQSTLQTAAVETKIQETEAGIPEATASEAGRPEFVGAGTDITDWKQALDRLGAGNEYYRSAGKNPAEFAMSHLKDLADHGQEPYAVVLTCSDSRVAPEHIFSAGVGDLFVVRTAGNVVNDFELGSIEYGAEHLRANVVVVMGHTNCGAVTAALSGHADGYIQSILDEVLAGVGDETEAEAAADKNISHSARRIMESEIIKELVENDMLRVVEAKYDIHTGEVKFFE